MDDDAKARFGAFVATRTPALIRVAHEDPEGYMRTVMLRLPPTQRAVLVLRFFEDLTETQAAEVLGCSVGTVRSRTHRALRRLRELLPQADVEARLTEVSG